MRRGPAEDALPPGRPGARLTRERWAAVESASGWDPLGRHLADLLSLPGCLDRRLRTPSRQGLAARQCLPVRPLPGMLALERELPPAGWPASAAAEAGRTGRNAVAPASPRT